MNIQVYCKSMGKIFPVTYIAKTDNEANKYLEKKKDEGVIATDKNGLVYIASYYAVTVPSSVLPNFK